MATVSEIYINPDSIINNCDINVGKDQLGLCVRINIPNGTVLIDNIWTATGLPGGLKPNSYVFVNNNVGNCDIRLPLIGTASTSASFGHEMQINNDPTSLGTITIRNSFPPASIITVLQINNTAVIRAANTGTNTWNVFSPSINSALPNLQGIVYGLTESSILGNTALGYQALLTEVVSGTSGDGNTAIGYQAGMNMATFGGVIQNTLVGYRAGLSLIDGFRNVILGNIAGSSIATDSSNNVVIGYDAYNIVAPAPGNANNVIIGVVAANAIPTAISSSIIIGAQAGQNVNGDGFVIIGINAGKVSTGTGIVYIGSNSGIINTTGINNTYLGSGSGNISTNGSNNTFLGFQSGKSITTGQQCTIIGSDISGSSTNTNGTTVIGYNNTYTSTLGIIIGNNSVNTAATSSIILGNSSTCTAARSIVLGNSTTCTVPDEFRIGDNITQIRAAGLSSTGAGTNLVFNAGVIQTLVSSRRYKTDINDFDKTDYSKKSVLSLNAKSFKMKDDKINPENTYIGLIAEEVDSAGYECLVNYRDNIDENGNKLDDQYKDKCPDSINYNVLSVLLLEEMKKMNQTIIQLQERITKLELSPPNGAINNKK